MPDTAVSTPGSLVDPGVAVAAADAAFRYGSDAPVATGVTATVAPGEALALIGPNGAGKSTIILGLLGLTTLHAGSLSVLGTTPAAARGSIGFVPQSLALDPQFPVTLEQVVAMGRYRRLRWRWPGRDDRLAVRRALQRVGLDSLRRRRFGMLSGGQQQRGLLARALVADPRLMVLDEPFNGLDQTNRDALLDIVRELKSAGVAFVISTHDLELAQAVCDSVLLINGEQVAAGPTDDVLTLENLERVFAGHQVELDEHTVVVPPHEGHA
ncbi:MAG: metal ABC transporter ATP-binding protein [Microcella sp.]|uniref:metal ABC transporter ATP-binding protein n=1 Tax=Microcella sp. TaxID=1913979 RepID=UPI0024CA6020|nr:metal ABC transporter ATP-binding protein [Microcella sp.]UYN83016.1 MAG: metal ABC transporter ATP-binding protein [Microcella sp.]